MATGRFSPTNGTPVSVTERAYVENPTAQTIHPVPVARQKRSGLAPQVALTRIDVGVWDLICLIWKFWIAWLIAGLIPTALLVLGVAILIAAIVGGS
jgi:hypothetical protein